MNINGFYKFRNGTFRLVAVNVGHMIKYQLFLVFRTSFAIALRELSIINHPIIGNFHGTHQ